MQMAGACYCIVWLWIASAGCPQPVTSEKIIHERKKKKQLKNRMVIVRRSCRLLSMVAPSPSAVRDIIEEPIHLSESDNEEEQHACPDKSEKSPAPNEEANHADHETVNEQFKDKATKRSRPDENLNPDISYKSLYIDSLKKVEALKEENIALAKRLDFALGKIEAYESLKDTVTHLKDIVLVSSLGRATEAAISMASQGTLGKSCLTGTPNGATEPGAAPNNVTEQSGGHAKRKK
ncbi:hypothetical protein LIER_17713 [Lithospermum erythrorhizon]|uniref:Uncharacterized protein n=1 Tax=Lithospermum erythrorhizon TaxID=34254 RepID=A0AAV3QBF8_LITER